MAELATIARPYAEALFKAAGSGAPALMAQVAAVAQVAGQPELRLFADNPKTQAAQVFEVITGVSGISLDSKVANLLHAVIDNGRLAAMPDIAAQFQSLVNTSTGVSDAVVHSAFPIEGEQLTELVATLEQRFARKLNARVQVDPELIGGVRVVVGDEVLDTSVKTRLEQMKVALTA